MKREKYEKILRQVSLWDWFARIFPIVFIAVASFMLATDLVTLRVTFLIGLVLFFGTAVLWWFWTIYTIAKMAFVLKRAEEDLGDVLLSIRGIRKGLLDDSDRERSVEKTDRSDQGQI
jgi:cell division protein FtsW (lipid II flippase)